MRQSKFFVPTTKSVPSDATAVSHQFMLKAGMIKQVAAGVYTYLPLMKKVLMKVEQIVREELEAIDCYEVLMPAMQPVELWKDSGRFDGYYESSETMRFKDRHDRQFFLGPTHEEVITDAVRGYVNSYKKLPLCMFQIQNKFRDERRPRFGLMRGREFSMMDAYSFSADQADLDRWYGLMHKAYCNIFDRCGLKYRAVMADNGSIGGDMSHEFMALCDIGEDTIKYCDSCDFTANVEVHAGDICPKCGATLNETKGIEVGHIFKLGTKYSEAMKAEFVNAENKVLPMVMGCYGIGVSRLVMAVIEQEGTIEEGLIWPEQIKPFDVHMMNVNAKDDEQTKLCDELYETLRKHGVNVLFDDRDDRLGSKLADSDLIGIPLRIVVGRNAANGIVEYQNRRDKVKEELTVSETLSRVLSER